MPATQVGWSFRTQSSWVGSVHSTAHHEHALRTKDQYHNNRTKLIQTLLIFGIQSGASEVTPLAISEGTKAGRCEIDEYGIIVFEAMHTRTRVGSLTNPPNGAVDRYMMISNPTPARTHDLGKAPNQKESRRGLKGKACQGFYRRTTYAPQRIERDNLFGRFGMMAKPEHRSGWG